MGKNRTVRGSHEILTKYQFDVINTALQQMESALQRLIRTANLAADSAAETPWAQPKHRLGLPPQDDVPTVHLLDSFLTMGKPRIVHGSPKGIQWHVQLSTALVVASREPAKILAISVHVKMIQLLRSLSRIETNLRIVHGLLRTKGMLLIARVPTVMIRLIP